MEYCCKIISLVKTSFMVKNLQKLDALFLAVLRTKLSLSIL